ncbi:hypothetical protein CRM22_000741 [Opisthorchis felineus]|uniref:Solute carrier family 12 member 9 n=2 Tax=Opisthorchis felineus TaxID=147828 RepID=A0A4S2MJW6_OPIFE|nr:hypothetical protein CRM22_000741 [Opisthorchis felineus]TGZ74808.1 hypothetical protein CRM22_000741 [Opisthorchis felineus]
MGTLTVEEPVTQDEPKKPPKSRRNLGTFGGVFCAITLSQFSSVIFLRLGFVVGHSGLLECILQFCLAYLILLLTILSVCAISTNGAIEGGGVYFMLSRTLGPEFGGAVGSTFFLAQVCCSALYITGFVEALVTYFGPQGLFVDGALPGGNRWWAYLYATCVVLLCLGILLIGSAMFARVLFFILTVVAVVIACVFASFFFHGFPVPVPRANTIVYNSSVPSNQTIYTNFTGLSWETLRNNLMPMYVEDYNTGTIMSFVIVFSVLFSGVTGIMNGANMSGELKNPARSIPLGTLSACLTTFLVYITLAVFSAASCSRELLQQNYVYMEGISFWPPIVVIGIFSTTLSAALGNLIGASRILEAVARDELFGRILRPAAWTTSNGNPIVAVLVSCFLSQLTLLIGRLNAIAPLVSILFLLSYATVNLACMLLDTASAANFRPTFRYFNWFTAFLGMIGSLIMCLLVQPIYTLVALIILSTMVFILHQRHLEYSWGSIGQALLFHQIRKYLLLLDARKDHVKYWRMQLLLLVSNPRSSASLVQFMNSVKKGGLFVIGHAIYGDPTSSSYATDVAVTQRCQWTQYSQFLHVKAFVEVTVDTSIRRALSHLMRISGLGAMRPNTVCLGFYENAPSRDVLSKILSERNSTLPAIRRSNHYYTDSTELLHASDSAAVVVANSSSDLLSGTPSTYIDEDRLGDICESLENGDSGDHRITAEEYVSLIREILGMENNVVLARHFDRVIFDYTLSGLEKMRLYFHRLRHRHTASTDSGVATSLNAGVANMGYQDSFSTRVRRVDKHQSSFFDIWPVNLLEFVNRSSGSPRDPELDKTGLFLLQLACLVARSPYWRSRPRPPLLRVFFPIIPVIEGPSESTLLSVNAAANMAHIWLRRLLHDLRIVADIQLVTLDSVLLQSVADPLSCVETLNTLIRSNCHPDTTALFIYLPKPPEHGAPRDAAAEYLAQLDRLTLELPPTLLAHGLHEVTSTSL